MSFPVPRGPEHGRLRAIQTEWQGVLYRSRAEARWRIFLDAAGIPCRYEVEGYELPGGRYLPDFWLPDQRCFVEVKGEGPDDRELTLAAQLAVAKRCPVYVFSGGIFVPSYGRRPPVPEATAVLYSGNAGGEGTDVDEGYCWCECPQCGALGITYRRLANRLACSCPRPDGGRRKVYNADSERLANAYRAAASARFEHGEYGPRA